MRSFENSRHTLQINDSPERAVIGWEVKPACLRRPIVLKYGQLWAVLVYNAGSEVNRTILRRQGKMANSKYGKYVITELIIPEEKKKIAAAYSKYATRILWMDENVVEGAFHMNTAWYLNAAVTLEDKAHVHDTDEIIGFFGNDASKPYDLGGEIEIWLEDEMQVLTRSALLFVPAGMKHCPLILRRVDRPIFHFTTVPGGRYVKSEK
jgi:hypothetical protein